MELRWINRSEDKIGIAHITDDDADVLSLLGGYEIEEENFIDTEWDNAEISVWKMKGLY